MTSTKNEELEYVEGKEYILKTIIIGCIKGYNVTKLSAWEKFAEEFSENKKYAADMFFYAAKELIRLHGYADIHAKMKPMRVLTIRDARRCTSNEPGITIGDKHPRCIDFSWKGLSLLTSHEFQIVADFMTKVAVNISDSSMFCVTTNRLVKLSDDDEEGNTFYLGDISES